MDGDTVTEAMARGSLSTTASPDVNHIEQNWQRLDRACETLVEQVSLVFDRFSYVLDTTERVELRESLERLARDSRGSSTIALRLDSHADLVERQVERLRELVDRCEI